MPLPETCARGHALIGDNVSIRSGGPFSCRVCGRLQARRYQARNRGLPVREMPPIIRGRPPLSRESCAVMSAKTTERLASPEGRAEMAPVWQRKVGRKRSAEVKRKMSEAKKRKPLNEV